MITQANPKNVCVIVEKLLDYLKDDDDMSRRVMLTGRVTVLAERYAPDSYWFIDTMNQIFEIGGNLVKSDSAFNLMRLIAEGQGEDEDEDAELRAYAVNCYIDMLAKSQG